MMTGSTRNSPSSVVWVIQPTSGNSLTYTSPPATARAQKARHPGGATWKSLSVNCFSVMVQFSLSRVVGTALGR